MMHLSGIMIMRVAASQDFNRWCARRPPVAAACVLYTAICVHDCSIVPVCLALCSGGLFIMAVQRRDRAAFRFWSSQVLGWGASAAGMRMGDSCVLPNARCCCCRCTMAPDKLRGSRTLGYCNTLLSTVGAQGGHSAGGM
jgi:hypothetical protein